MVSRELTKAGSSTLPRLPTKRHLDQEHLTSPPGVSFRQAFASRGGAVRRRQRIPHAALEARLQLRHPGIELGRLRLLLVDRDFTGEGVFVVIKYIHVSKGTYHFAWYMHGAVCKQVYTAVFADVW